MAEPIPHSYAAVKEFLNKTQLSSTTKKILFLTVDDVINTLNNSGMYNIIPDKAKHVIPVMIGMNLIINDKLTKLMEKVNE